MVWRGLVCLVLLAGCQSKALYLPGRPSAADGQWTQIGGARGDANLPQGPAPPLRLLWQQGIDASPWHQPFFDGRLLLVWSRSPTVYAYDLFDGSRLGKRAIDDRVCGASAVVGPWLVFAQKGGQETDLRALDRRNGKVAWRLDGLGCVRMAARNDTLWVADEAGALLAVTAKDGQEIWRLAVDGQLRVEPGLGRQALYGGTSRGDVVAVDAASGHERWQTRLDAAIRSRPLVRDDSVYVATAAGTVAALGADGTVLWQQSLGVLPTPGLALGGDVLVVGTVDRQYHALDAASGRRLWSFATEGVVRSAPAIAGQVVYGASSDGHLYALDLESGRLQWKYRLDGPVVSGIGLGKGRLAVVTEERTLYVFGR